MRADGFARLAAAPFPVVARRDDNVVGAGFCLFAVEWECRSYTGGPWPWDSILRPTGLAGWPTQLVDP